MRPPIPAPESASATWSEPALVTRSPATTKQRVTALFVDALLAVVALNLYHVVFEGARGRTLIRVLDFLTVGSLASFATISVTTRHRRLGNLFSGTAVIKEGEGL